MPVKELGEAPAASSPAVRRSMQGNKAEGTKPELKLRKALRDAGFPGYRLHWNKVPGRPDIAYPGRKIAVFLHGCFWHRCPTCRLPQPKSNTEYWNKKFELNVARDTRKIRALEDAGWTALVIWECELKKAPEQATETLIGLLRRT